MKFLVQKDTPVIKGEIQLDGSKSISNRVLMIRALCKKPFQIHNLSSSDDTKAMESLITRSDGELDVGPAGTTFRFLTAYFATREGEQILTGSTRMKQRPIGALVDALRLLGADIKYLAEAGYPPLLIKSPKDLGRQSELNIPANISSQFISALLMIAPVLPGGIKLKLVGQLVSASYLKMTLDMMKQFGIEYHFEDQIIEVRPQEYQPSDFRVESDWSAASYHYALAALAQDTELTLRGLYRNSSQGDAATPELFANLGLSTDWLEDGVLIRKNGDIKSHIEHDFILCPDIAQTVAVVCGALGVSGAFTGLETLSIKETDRILALKNELGKVGVSFVKTPARFNDKTGKIYHLVEGKADWSEPPVFATYHDHRMAMAFAPLSIIKPVIIDDPDVVGKSYPGFWRDLIQLGWRLDMV